MSRWLHRMRVILRSLISFRREDDELHEEFQYHFDRLIDAGREAGLTPEEARRAAGRAMGPIEASKEECRDVRPTRLIRDLVADLRYAGRAFRRTLVSRPSPRSSWRSASGPTRRSSASSMP